MRKAGVSTPMYVATYSDPTAAQQDWDDIKQLARDDVIRVDGLVLVSLDDTGKIDVKDNAIFPPALLASAAVGAGIGAGTGAVVDRRQKKEIKADVEEVLPPGSR